MTTARDVCQILLDYLSAEERTIPSSPSYPGRTNWALLALNGALQEIYGMRPEWFTRQARGEAVYGPLTRSATASGTRTLEIATDDWMAHFEGSSVDLGLGGANNRGVRITQTGDGATPYKIELENPHGAAGTVSVTFWNDAIPLAAGSVKVLPPVKIEGYGELIPVNGRADLWGHASHDADYGAHRRASYVQSARAQPSLDPGTPAVYCVEGAVQSEGGPKLWLRFAPAANRDMLMTFAARVVAPKYVEDNITDADTSPEIPIAHDWVESLLLPIASQRFTACPYWRNKMTKEEITRQYKVAMLSLKSNHPQARTGVVFRPAH